MASPSGTDNSKTGPQPSGTSVHQGLSPTIIGHYSMTGEIQDFDGSNCAQIVIDWDEASEKKLKTPMDLNMAMDKVQRKNMKNHFNDRLKKLQHWILEHSECMNAKPNFVTSRGVMQRLLTSIYPQEEHLVLHATKIGETIFLLRVPSKKEMQEQENASEEQQKNSHYGFKFEQFMTDGADPSTGNNENKSYYVIVQAELANEADFNTLLYEAEVDGMNKKFYKDDRLPNCDELIELKTGMLKVGAMEQSLKPYKMRNTWAQCWPVGIPLVVCGFRDEGGVVGRIRSFRVADLPRDSQKFKNKIDFSPDKMVNALNEFLEWAKTEVKDDEVVYELTVTQPLLTSKGQTVKQPQLVIEGHTAKKPRLLDDFSVKQPPLDKAEDPFRSSRLSPTSQFLLPDFVQAMRSN
ncbi:decapping nuclease RAI1-like [Hyalella azteca]|uniref:Decapping nuclease n=1 Tax=Hyalella azteca TaxID=294128 RepID=A0A8B7PLE2_HYAAZ|nr:decapping nuclease RAI1-like [Hyalella azteca]